MPYNSKLPADTTAPAEIRENFRALKEDKIVAALSASSADTAAKLTNARKISLEGDATGTTTFDGSSDVSITVEVANADTATKLRKAHTINGVAFDGSADITIHGFTPASAIQYFARSTAPDGWLEADGAAVSRTQYPNLFDAIGTMFGTGDGSTTFNLPDLRGEFIRGWSHNRIGTTDDGRILGSWQTDMFKSHNHIYNDQGHGYGDSGNGTWARGEEYGPTLLNTTRNQGEQETRPRNIALLPCIKY